MADIRINALATTAASTASDDFIAVDGSANGTRKLDAYSPTFGGNLTVSGTGGITSTAPSPLLRGSTSVLGGVPKLTLENTNLGAWNVYLSGTDGGDFKIDQDSTNKFRIAYGTGNATLTGNLTVSGGTIGTAAATNLTLAGGSSGASLVLGQGTNGAPTLAAAGSGTPTITKLGAANGARRVALSLQTGADGTLGPVNIELAAYPSATGSDRYGSLSVGDTGAWRPLVLQHAGGNVLVGTTTDGGQKLQVAGTIKTTTGVEVGNGFGVTGTNGSVGVFPNANELTAVSFDSMLFKVYDGSAYTTQLTLGSGASPNATFAGTVIANKATTAFRIPTAETPASASATGTIGTITWDASYIYVCTAANTWKRVAIATWP